MQLRADSQIVRIRCSNGKTITFPASARMDDTDGPVGCNANDSAAFFHENKKKRPRNVTRELKKPLKTEVAKASYDIEDISFIKEETLEIRGSLLSWYDQNQRDLPWRRISKSGDNNNEESERRAYAVWVSEVMLQQTRVQKVIGYFNRWMSKWPTLQHLSQASLEEVNEMWAGLGYYRRGRFLLEGAKMIVEAGGGFPNRVSDLREVKGIGDYTAGAIASIAYQEVVPVVDGNVIRVISRLKTISKNPKDLVAVKTIWALAAQLVDPCRPGDFNQALMELGATLCTPSNPSCNQCPIASQCRAYSLSSCDDSVSVTDYPGKAIKAEKRHDFAAVSVVEILEGQNMERRSSKFLLVKRADEGLLAGLWEFPSVLLDGEVNLATRRRVINTFLKSAFNLDVGRSCMVKLRENVGEYVHVFTHIRLKMFVEFMVLELASNHVWEKEQGEEIKCKYVDWEALCSMGLSSGVRKVYNMVEIYKRTRLTSTTMKESKAKKSRIKSSIN